MHTGAPRASYLVQRLVRLWRRLLNLREWRIEPASLRAVALARLRSCTLQGEDHILARRKESICAEDC